MKWSRWTPEACSRLMDLYLGGYSAREIAAMMGRTEQAVRLRLLGSGYSSRRIKTDTEVPTAKADIALPSPLDAHEKADSDYYETRARAELEAQLARREERGKVEEAKRLLLEDRIAAEFSRVLSDLPRAPLKLAPPPVIRDTDGSALTAVLVVSDVHLGQIVCPHETANFGCYNPAIALARVRHLELEAARIMSERPIEKLLVLFAGDMVHGKLNHSLEEDVVPVARQVDLAIHIFFPFLCGLAMSAPSVEVYGVEGNHGRWPGGQRKMPTERRWSSLDSILYNALGALCTHAGLRNVRFDDGVASRRVIEAGNFRLQLQHGDQVRGGAFCTGGMSREVTNSTLRHVQSGRRPVDYYVMGDKHTSSSMSFGKGAFIVNGSFVGPDNFGLNFVAAPPSQTLFFLHPLLGKTETHEIRLDFARLSLPLPYPLKPSLEELVLSHINPNESYENTTTHPTAGRATLADAA